MPETLRVTGSASRLALRVGGGAVSGYTTSNQIYPDDRAAIVVFTNIYPGAADAPGKIGERIANIIFTRTDTARADALESARQIYDGLTRGVIDRARFTPAANAYFTQEVLSDYATSLAPLGSPTEFAAVGESLRGGMRIRSYRIRAGGVLMELRTMTLPDGRLDRSVHNRAGRLISRRSLEALFIRGGGHRMGRAVFKHSTATPDDYCLLSLLP